jgi:hypothetical protein
MASNIAARRAAKSARRKAVVAEKRKAEMFEGSLAARVRRAATAPVQECLLPENLFEEGIGAVILARGTSPDHLNVGVFLVDVACLGVKNVFFRSLGSEEYELLIATTSRTQPLADVDPSHARKLLRDVTAWSGSIGFAPHRDFAAVEPLFGDVSADACDATFEFGRDGKPFYLPGPFETPAQVRLRLEQLRMRLGDDGFEFVIAA